MALLTSGNCLELFYTKKVVRWALIVLLAAMAFIMAGALPAGSDGAWGAHNIALLALVVLFAIGAALPLACPTPKRWRVIIASDIWESP